MPEVIAHGNSGPKKWSKTQWRKLVHAKVQLLSWFAINDRGGIKPTDMHARYARAAESICSFCEAEGICSVLAAEANNKQPSVDALLSCMREDIRLSDRGLLTFAEEQTNDAATVDRAALQADAQWALKQWGSGAFDGIEHDYVAVLNQQMCGAGDDPNELKRHLSKKLEVVSQRIFVKYVGA